LKTLNTLNLKDLNSYFSIDQDKESENLLNKKQEGKKN